jgi:hypothetical protein
MFTRIVLAGLVSAGFAVGYALAQGAPVKLPDQSFQAASIVVDGMVGKLDVMVGGAGPIVMSVEGEQDAIERFHAEVKDNVLRIRQDDSRALIDFSFWTEDSAEKIHVVLTAPSGTPLNIDGLVGDAAIGDLNAPLHAEVAAGSVKAGLLTEASIEAAGAGDITLGAVTGKLDIEVAGGGDMSAGDVGSVELSIAGSGDITLGNIAGGISIEIAGSGEVKAQSVNGPVKIEVAGAGDITIDSGKATSFDVEIMGAGDIKFGGEANNPKVEMFGSGDVWIRSYTGSLSSEGGGEVRVGGDG